MEVRTLSGIVNSLPTDQNCQWDCGSEIIWVFPLVLAWQPKTHTISTVKMSQDNCKNSNNFLKSKENCLHFCVWLCAINEALKWMNHWMLALDFALSVSKLFTLDISIDSNIIWLDKSNMVSLHSGWPSHCMHYVLPFASPHFATFPLK